MTITTIHPRGISTTTVPLAHHHPVTERAAIVTDRDLEIIATAVKGSTTIMMTAFIGGEMIVVRRKTTTKVTVGGERRGNEESKKAVVSSN